MKARQIKVQVTYEYVLTIDDDGEIVKEYNNDKELVDDLASYQFSILPIINNGVKIDDVTVLEVSIQK